MLGSLNYPICHIHGTSSSPGNFFLVSSRSEFSSAIWLGENEGCSSSSQGEEERLAHILNIKQANCKEETFLPLEGKRTSSLPSILILPSCPPAIRHTLSEASQQLQPCLKSSNRVPTSDIIINGRKKAFSKY